ncbi:MAG: glycosyltransferase family 2 protein [Crocinitomicaceae bacterium]|nr:glycosyltransferase family 2 protein [Crocinitomicaceae bacterium]
MKEPILSVLLPNFNNAPFLRQCLDSVYNQSFQDFVIYFIDDCSTDDSIEIAVSYPQEKK